MQLFRTRLKNNEAKDAKDNKMKIARKYNDFSRFVRVPLTLIILSLTQPLVEGCKMVDNKTKETIPVKLSESEMHLRNILLRMGANNELVKDYRESSINEISIKKGRGKLWRFEALGKLAENCEKLGLSYGDFFKLKLIFSDPSEGNLRFAVKEKDPLKTRRAFTDLENALRSAVKERNLDFEHQAKMEKWPRYYFVKLDNIKIIKNELCVDVSFVAKSQEIPKKAMR